MIEILISSSALILALLIMRKLFRKNLSRRVQYALWALVLVRLLVPVNLPAVDFSVLTAAKPVEETVTQTITEQPIFVPVTQEPLEEHPLAWKIAPEHTLTAVGESVWVARTEQKTAVEYRRLAPQTVLFWVWAAGSCLAGIFLLTANLRFWLWLRKVRKPYEIEDCKLRVYSVEAGLPSPCLFGLFRPAIYLTPGVLESEDRLRHVIVHETTHAHHLDHLWTLLRGVCLAVYWFHPLVWAAAAASKIDCELACDEGALARLEESDRIPYGKTLLSLIPVRQTVNPLLAATAMTAGATSVQKKNLKDRFARIAKKSQQTVAAIVSVAILTVAVSACTFTGGNSGKVVVCFDIASSGERATADYQEAVTGFLNWIDDCHKYLGLSISSEDVEVDIIPGTEEESAARGAALQRIRAELMAGKGPDIFISTTLSDWYSQGEEFTGIEGGRLFPYVEKTMDSGIFLPLDDILAKLTISNPDDLIPQVMEGGKNQKGEQVLLPLSFTVPGIMFSGDDLPGGEYAGTSWDDVLRGDDLALAEQAVWPFNFTKPNFSQNKNYVRMGVHDSGLSYLFPQVADFETEEPYLSEEEIFQTVRDSITAYRNVLDRETERFSCSIYVSDIMTDYNGSDHAYPGPANTPYTFMPLRNTLGGSTAAVIGYCAVNFNTKREDKVRDVLDALLCEDFQRGGRFYRHFRGMSVNRNLSGMPDGGAYFTGQKLEAWQRICEDINIVRFPSALDAELDAMMKDIEDAMYAYRLSEGGVIFRNGEFMKGSVSDEEMKSIISKHYQNMQRLLDES
ncbi:MAG: hypothetical protein J1E06_09095 [Acutalibacter sp.]|nr:hypothetical protein [Acutalibacter sp.]